MGAVDFLISRLAVASVEFLLVGFLVGSLLAVFRSITPRWRCRIWLVAMLKPFITVLTGFFGGFLPVPGVISRSLLGDVMFPVASGEKLLPGGGVAASFVYAAAYVWIIVTVALLVRVWLRWLMSRQLIDDSLEKGYRIKPSALRRLDPSLVVPPDVDIIVTPEDAGPATLGIKRPSIIIPESLLPWVIQHRDPTPEECERFCQVLRHEVGHASNKDGWVSLAAMILLSFFWFHPIAHWAYRRVRLNNEICCDLGVVAAGIDAQRYVDTLMNVVADSFSRKGLALSILGDSSPAGMLRRRLQFLLNEPARSRFKRPVGAYVTLSLVVLALPNFLGAATEYVNIRFADGHVQRIPLEDWPQYANVAELVHGQSGALLAESFLAGVNQATRSSSEKNGLKFSNDVLASSELLALPEEGDRGALNEISLDIPADAELIANLNDEDQEELADSGSNPKPKPHRSSGPIVGPIEKSGNEPILPVRSPSGR